MTEIILTIFSLGAIISGLLVISSTNPVHSVFSLVLAFVNCSLLLIMINVEFLAFLFIIVYVGAIAILFLFVVMMLNIRLVELIDNATRYVPVGFIIGMILLWELIIITDKQMIYKNNLLIKNENNIIIDKIYDWTNITTIGNYLYTDGWIYFLVSSIILFISMIGAIILTLYHEKDVKRQDIFAQITTEKTIKNVFK